ncbi:MAG: NUDIX hydrolase [Phycisphaerales bacterium]
MNAATRKRGFGGVAVLALRDVEDATYVVLIRKDKRARGADLFELPSGGMLKGETPHTAAARELREETGYTAATMEALTRFHTEPGVLEEPMHAYVACGLEAGRQALEEGERLSVHEWTVEDALAAVDDGRITDAKTMLVLLLARSRGLI